LRKPGSSNAIGRSLEDLPDLPPEDEVLLEEIGIVIKTPESRRSKTTTP